MKGWTWKDKIDGIIDDPMGGLLVALEDDFTPAQRKKAVKYLKERLDKEYPEQKL